MNKSVLYGCFVSIVFSSGVYGADVVQKGVAPKESKLKKLGEMTILSNALEKTPIGLVRMELGFQSATKTLQVLEKMKDDPQVYADAMKKVLAPVKEFFNYIQDYALVIKPLIVASVLDGQAPGTGKTSLLLDFLSSEQLADSFFDKNVKTKDALKKACDEFALFFGDLKAGLSDGARKAYHEVLKQIIDAQKKAASKPVAAPAA